MSFAALVMTTGSGRESTINRKSLALLGQRVGDSFACVLERREPRDDRAGERDNLERVVERAPRPPGPPGARRPAGDGAEATFERRVSTVEPE